MWPVLIEPSGVRREFALHDFTAKRKRDAAQPFVFERSKESFYESDAAVLAHGTIARIYLLVDALLMRRFSFQPARVDGSEFDALALGRVGVLKSSEFGPLATAQIEMMDSLIVKESSLNARRY